MGVIMDALRDMHDEPTAQEFAPMGELWREISRKHSQDKFNDNEFDYYQHILEFLESGQDLCSTKIPLDIEEPELDSFVSFNLGADLNCKCQSNVDLITA